MLVGSQFGPDDDRTIWHFTDGNGFLGILKSRSIWASSAIFLNDSNEVVEVFRAVRRCAADLDLSDTQLACLEAGLARAGDRPGSIGTFVQSGVYVASFSSSCGDLGQWRAYGSGRGGSYCLGFSPNFIEKAASPLGFSLAPVAYSFEEQRALVAPILDALMEAAAKLELNATELLEQSNRWPLQDVPPELPQAILAFSDSIRAVAPLIKNRSFEEEKEFRLVHHGGLDRERIQFRTTETGIVPYVEINFPNRELHLRGAIVGPSPRLEQNWMAASMALNQPGIECLGCSTSGIPYRSW